MQTARGASLSDAETPTVTTERRPRRVGTLLVVASVAYVLDQVTKAVAVQQLEGRPPVEVLGEVLSLRLVRNPGAAFGVAGSATVVFTVVAALVAVAILRTATRLRSRSWALALGLLLGGAVGNLTDRLLRPPGPLRGHVIDFLELPRWPVFNVADMAIVSGAVLIVVLTWRGRQLDGTRDGG